MKNRLRTGRIISLSEEERYGRLLVMRRMVMAIAISSSRWESSAEMTWQLL
jgi:hypothetical protein